MILRIFAISAAALVAGSFIENARAGQYFVCDDGTAIEIETARIERAKQTIPCVAQHFGLEITVKPKADVVADEEPNAIETQHSVAPPPTIQHHGVAPPPSIQVVLPVRKPAPVELRETDTEPAPSRRPVRSLIADAAKSDPSRVRIINAQPGGSAWFHVKP